MQSMSDDVKNQILSDALQADIESRRTILRLRRIIIVMTFIIMALLVKCIA